jgi:hypothetical protein
MKLSNIKFNKSSVVREAFEAWIFVNRLSANCHPCFEISDIDGQYITPGMEERFQSFINGWISCEEKFRNPTVKLSLTVELPSIYR